MPCLDLLNENLLSAYLDIFFDGQKVSYRPDGDTKIKAPSMEPVQLATFQPRNIIGLIRKKITRDTSTINNMSV